MPRFLMKNSASNCKNFVHGYRLAGRRVGGAFAALAAVNLGVQLLAGGAFAVLLPGREMPIGFTWLLSFLPLYGVAFPVFFTLLQRQSRIVPVRRRMGFGNFAAFFCMAMTVMYAGSVLGQLINWLVGLATGAPPLSELEALIGAAPVWQTLLFACLLAPIGEELIFCTLLQHALPFGERAAILFTALAFGAFHGNLYQFFYAFLVRLLFSYAYARFGRMELCMLLHAMVNVMGGVVGQLVLGASDQALAVYALALVLVAGVGCVLLYRRWAVLRLAAARPGANARWLFACPGAIAAWVLLAAVTALALF